MLKFAKVFLIIIYLFLPSIVQALTLEVNISGVDPQLVDSIRADLHLQQAITEPKVTSARVQNLYDLAAEQIRETLEAKGYYNSTVIPSLNTDGDRWIANFAITLGNPTIINSTSITIEGPAKNDPRIKPFLRNDKLINGQVLIQADYEYTKDKLLSDFNSIGYLQADFTQSVIEVNRDTNRADIKFVLYSGKQYVFGKIKFIDGVYEDDFLIRYAPFHPGQPYELQQLVKFQNNLEQGDLFSKIRFDPIVNTDDPSDYTVPVDVRLVPKPRNRYTGSVGYGTDTGIRGSLGWLHRRTSTPGHQVFSYLGLSKILRVVKVNYIIPGTQPATDQYLIGAAGQEEFIQELYSRKAEVYATKTMKRGKLESLYGLNYFTETFHITANTPNINKKYLLPNVKWIWLNSSEKDDFTVGTRFELRLRGGIQGVLSSTSVIQADLGLKHIWPVVENTRFIFRSNIGSVTSRGFSSLPPSLRYFTGGDDTVRGFKFYSIGPRAIPGDPNSENVGGRYLFIASGELEHRIYKEFSGVLFFDSGNASMNFGGPLAMGSGFGIRYKTPLGNLRADLAKPLNTIENKHWRLHLTFGTDL